MLARVLTPRDFGRFAAASVVIGLGSALAESGLLAALIQRDEETIDDAASTAVVWSVFLGVGIACGSLALAPLLGMLFQSDAVAELEAALSGVLLLRAGTIVPDALLQRRFSFLRRVVVDPLGALVYAGVAIALGSHDGAWSLVAGTYASAVVQLASSWGFVRWRPSLGAASWTVWRELAGYSRHVLASNVIWRAASQLDTVVVGRLLGAGSLGQYRNGWRLAYQPLDAWLRVGAYVLLPTLSRLAPERDRFRLGVQRTIHWMSTALIPVSAGMLALGQSLTAVALGPRWEPAGRVTAALCGLFLGQAFISLGSEIFKSLGRPRTLIATHVVYAGLLAVGLGTTTSFGLVPAAVSVSAASMLAAAYNLRAALGLVDLGLSELRTAITPALSSGAMAGGLILLDHLLRPGSEPTATGALLLSGEAVLGVLVYSVVLCAIDRRRRRELVSLVRDRRTPRAGADPVS